MAKRKTISKLSDLTPDTSNANKGTERGRYMVEASLTETGAGRSIVADKDGRIIAGNKTLEAWAGMGGAVKVVETDGHELVVVQRTDLDLSDPKGKARKLAYYDNRAGQVGLEWDAAQLLADVNAGVDLAAMFKADEIAELLAGVKGGAEADAEPQIDQAEELNKKWQVKPGDLWRIGAHRLLCGDSTKAADVARVEPTECAAMVFDPDWDSAPTMPPMRDTLAFTDGQRCGDVVRMFGAPAWVFVWDCVSSWFTPSRPLKRGKLCLWYGDVSAYQFDGAHYGDSGEAREVHNTRGGYAFKPDPRGKHLSDVFSAPITKLHSESEHNHSKPVDWVRMLIGNCTRGDVYEPFAGSGTTLVACENLGRKCRAIEISPAYCAVILERMAQAFPKLEITRDDGAG